VHFPQYLPAGRRIAISRRRIVAERAWPQRRNAEPVSFLPSFPSFFFFVIIIIIIITKMYYARFLVFPATKMTDFSLTRVYENPTILNCSATTTTIYRGTQYCLSFFHSLPPTQLNNRGGKKTLRHTCILLPLAI